MNVANRDSMLTKTKARKKGLADLPPVQSDSLIELDHPVQRRAAA